MVVLAPGSFVMGTTDKDADRWDDVRESPARTVTLRRPFAIGRLEITRAQFRAYAEDVAFNEKGCSEWGGTAWNRDAGRDWRDPGFAQRDDEPVVCVSWVDAKAYAAWLARKTGRSYRLATEAEWEYAARAGSVTSRYWGEAAADGCVYANIGDRSVTRLGMTEGLARCDDGYTRTAPVGSFKPNAFGLHDMLGNVWEWTEDCWQPGYIGAPVDGSARVDGACSIRVPRGASWNSHYRNVRSANRGSYEAAGRYTHIGIRVVSDVGE
jgi:formylglycine-generating enzyme